MFTDVILYPNILGKEQARDALITAEAGCAERWRGPSGVSQLSGNLLHLGERSSWYLSRHHQKMCNDVVEELLLSDRDEISSPDACTLGGNNLWNDKFYCRKREEAKKGGLQKQGCALQWDHSWPCLVGPALGDLPLPHLLSTPRYLPRLNPSFSSSLVLWLTDVLRCLSCVLTPECFLEKKLTNFVKGLSNAVVCIHAHSCLPRCMHH